jgi:hypothetical protein
MNVPTRFLDPRVLAPIRNLDLVAKTVVDGFMAGLHQSPHLGVSTDFAEHRPYMAGDDIRRIDWRLYGRTDRLYVKEIFVDGGPALKRIRAQPMGRAFRILKRQSHITIRLDSRSSESEA